MDLSGLWEFKLGDYETPGDNCERLAGGERIAVPASYNDQKDDPAYKNHYGGPGMKERSRFLPF